MKKIGLLNGPNLDRLGKREPEIYGNLNLEEIVKKVKSKAKPVIVKWRHSSPTTKVSLSTRFTMGGFRLFRAHFEPRGLTHTSVALRDAVVASGLKTVEVHLSNIHAREDFRHKSLISGIASAVVVGMSQHGYISALRYLSVET